MKQMQYNVKVHFLDKEGQVLATREGRNRIVNMGLAIAAARLTGVTKAAVSKAGIGTGTTAAAAADTALETPVGTKVSISVSVLSKNVTGDGFTATATFAGGNPATSAAVTEAGLFNDDDELFARFVFPPYNKGEADTIILEWDVWNEYIA